MSPETDPLWFQDQLLYFRSRRIHVGGPTDFPRGKAPCTLTCPAHQSTGVRVLCTHARAWSSTMGNCLFTKQTPFHQEAATEQTRAVIVRSPDPSNYVIALAHCTWKGACPVPLTWCPGLRCRLQHTASIKADVAPPLMLHRHAPIQDSCIAKGSQPCCRQSPSMNS